MKRVKNIIYEQGAFFSTQKMSLPPLLIYQKVKHLKPESKVLPHLVYQYSEVSGKAIAAGVRSPVNFKQWKPKLIHKMIAVLV